MNDNITDKNVLAYVFSTLPFIFYNQETVHDIGNVHVNYRNGNHRLHNASLLQCNVKIDQRGQFLKLGVCPNSTQTLAVTTIHTSPLTCARVFIKCTKQ